MNGCKNRAEDLNNEHQSSQEDKALEIEVSRRVVRNSIVLSVGLLLGRLSGYVRELIVAGQYGTSGVADSILLLLALPDLTNNLLSTTTLGALVIPILHSSPDREGDVLRMFFRLSFKLALLCFFLAIPLTFYLSGGVADVTRALLLSNISIFPNVIGVGFVCYLQFKDRFTTQALGTFLFNLAFILGLVTVFNGVSTIESLAVVVVLAATLRLLAYVWDSSRNHPIRYFFQKHSVAHAIVPPKLGDVILIVLSSGLVFTLPSIDKFMAVRIGEGAVAALSYAEKLYLLPVSVLLTTQAVAIFPHLSRIWTSNEKAAFESLVHNALKKNLILSLLVASATFVFAHVIVSLLYGTIGLGGDSTIRVSDNLRAYSGAVLLSGSVSILLSALFAQRRIRLALVYGSTMLALKVMSNIVVIYLGLGEQGIAAMTSASMLIATILLYQFVSGNDGPKSKA